MNLLGKILTLIVLLFSFVFLVVAVIVFQTHRSWKDIALKNKSEIVSLQGQVKLLKSEIETGKDRLALEQAARRFALGALQTRVELSESQLQVREQEFARLQAEAGNLTQTVSTTSQTVDAAIKQNEDLRKLLRDSEQDRNTVFDAVVQLTDKKNELEGTSQILSERSSQLNNMLTMAVNVLRRKGFDLYTPVNDIPPVVEGLIVRVGAKDLLEISIGSDDGLRQGHTLEVYRDKSYLGRVIVRETQPDRAVVQIIPEYRKGIIKVGDRVATKLG